ncbi:MAG: hypothetical protein ACLPX5_09065 [Dissulfurispiraceae bacterium]
MEKKAFGRCFNYAVRLFAVLCVLSFVHVGGIGIQGVGPVEAKITEETIVPAEATDLLNADNPDIKRVMDTQDRHVSALMAIPDVVGAATGLSRDGSPAIVVFTKKRMRAGTIPATLEGIPVAVKITGKIFALRKNSGKTVTTGWFASPVPIGVSTGNAGECSAGTIGARVIDNKKNLYALSCNHVYALENTAPNGSFVLQPGLYDTGCAYSSNNVLGTLSSFVTINFGGNNTVDAAIASVPGSSTSLRQLGNSTPADGYGTPNSLTYTQATTQSPYVGQHVKKYGRTTRLTTGAIKGIHATVNVCYNSSCSLIATFSDQIVIGGREFSQAGDSGSLIVTNDSNAYPVALLFAGSSSTTIANPIDTVLSSLGVTIDGK